METAREERIRATQSLRQLEEAAALLEDAAKDQNPEKISPGFPGRLTGVLNELTALNSRDDAERLLATGVSLWNSVILFEGFEVEQDTNEALVKIRHVAADCMYMSTTVLGGISARFNIDDLTLLKFYTACGQKYASVVSDMDMADVCFSKAAEFVEPALNESRSEDGDQMKFSQAMFDLLLGRAECSWEKGDRDQAENSVNDAHKFMKDLPGKHEFLASVEFNFGLFTYQAKETERALKWLKKSMKTRGSDANTVKNLEKQAKTARLAGVCLLALQDYEGSWDMMKSAEDMHHDPVGSYLLLKLSLITKKPDAFSALIKTIEDPDINLDVCMACISLFGDSQRLSDAAVGFERLFARFSDNPKAIAGTVGLRYFETLAALGKTEKAIEILEVCCGALDKLKNYSKGDDNEKGAEATDEDTSAMAVPLSKWPALLLATGTAQADRKDFYSASQLLNRALGFARTYCSYWNSCENGTDSVLANVVLENESAVCRLASSCAICAIDDLQRKPRLNAGGNPDSGKEDGQDFKMQNNLLKIALVHAERSKVLEATDFAPRLLLFRAYLVSKEYQKAALEMRQASLEIRSFDPSALAEAACAARDVGSKSAVIATLRCILKMDPATLSKNLVATSSSPPKGFFGRMLLTCVHILLEEEEQIVNTSRAAEENGDECSQDEKCDSQLDRDLLDTLQSGLKGIEKLGLDFAFGQEKENVRDSLTYLANVCWNRGRKAGTRREFATWGDYFDTCYQFCSFLQNDAENLQKQRMSKLMCATSTIENEESRDEDFQRARSDITEARRVSRMLQEVSPCAGEDPIEGLLLILEARCCVGCKDLDSLVVAVETALQKQGMAAGVFEQLASVSHNYHEVDVDKRSETRVRCADLTAALFSKAVDVRLCDGRQDLNALAVAIREHLGVEVSRGSSAGRAYSVFMKAVGIVLENQSEYPNDERRWLVAIGWDRAEMYRRLGQSAEARRWCQGVKQIAQECVVLSSYMPRIDSFLRTI